MGQRSRGIGFQDLKADMGRIPRGHLARGGDVQGEVFEFHPAADCGARSAGDEPEPVGPPPRRESNRRVNLAAAGDVPK